MTTIKNENKSYIKNNTFDEKKNNEIYEEKNAKSLYVAKIASKVKTQLA